MNTWSALVFDERFWLPRNVTWNDFALQEQEKNVRLADPKDLLYVLPLACIIYAAQILFKRCVAEPIGHSLGIGSEVSRAKPRHMKVRAAGSASHSTSLDVQQPRDSHQSIDRNESSSSSIDRGANISPLVKFSESCWRFAFYFSSFVCGVILLQNKSWTWDSYHCWLDYPRHSLTTDMFWYYMTVLAFYWSLLLSLPIEAQRKDFRQMLLHHVTAIMLLSFSYIGNFVRVGSLVLVIHDCADYWLEFAKMAIYVRAKRTGDFAFAIFALIWFVTRICYYPYRILYGTIFKGATILGPFPAYFVFATLLTILYTLHCYWFYLICKIAVATLKTGEVRDVRSDSEDNDDDSKDN